ncbi:MAG: phosphate-starvation-inducible PsiE family protein [Synechococcus sp.]
MSERRMPWWRRLGDDGDFLHLIDRGEQQLAKALALMLCVVIAAATVQLVLVVGSALFQPGNRWMGDDLTAVLGDLLNLLIALEVLQNITSYLRQHVVQIELVLLTAITAVARKVIVLPPGAENKPQLLLGLGIAVLCLAAAFWLVRSLSLRKPPARTGPAIRIRETDRFAPPDGVDGE